MQDQSKSPVGNGTHSTTKSAKEIAQEAESEYVAAVENTAKSHNARHMWFAAVIALTGGLLGLLPAYYQELAGQLDRTALQAVVPFLGIVLLSFVFVVLRSREPEHAKEAMRLLRKADRAWDAVTENDATKREREQLLDRLVSAERRAAVADINPIYRLLYRRIRRRDESVQGH